MTPTQFSGQWLGNSVDVTSPTRAVERP